MSKKTIGIVVTVLGLIGLAVSLLADYIGLGSGQVEFGPRQLAAIGVSLVVTIVGVVLLLWKKKGETKKPD
jgi:sugar phosphate permease